MPGGTRSVRANSASLSQAVMLDVVSAREALTSAGSATSAGGRGTVRAGRVIGVEVAEASAKPPRGLGRLIVADGPAASERALPARASRRLRRGSRPAPASRAVVFLVLVGREAEQLRQHIALLRFRRRSDALFFAADRAGATSRRERHAGWARAALLDVGERQRIAGQRLAVGRNMHGAAVREHARQLIMRHARPVAYRADVEMHEGEPSG